MECGEPWRNPVSLLSDDQRLSELPRRLIESLIGQNRIEVVASKDSSKSAISERLSRARESDLCVANQRVRLISHIGKWEVALRGKRDRRTFFRWLARYPQQRPVRRRIPGSSPESAHRDARRDYLRRRAVNGRIPRQRLRGSQAENAVRIVGRAEACLRKSCSCCSQLQDLLYRRDETASSESNTKTTRSARKLQVGDVLLGVGSENAPTR